MRCCTSPIVKGPSIVVIGGGAAGLVSALHLSARGAQVAILERSEQLGGRLSVPLDEEWKSDPGLHLIHGDGPWSQTLRKASKVRLPIAPTPELHVLVDGHMSQPPFGVSGGRHGETSRFAAYKWIKKISARSDPGQRWMETVDSFDGLERMWASILGTLVTMEWNPDVLHHTVRRAMSNGIRRHRLGIPVRGWADCIGRLIFACEQLNAIISTGCDVTAVDVRDDGVVVEMSEHDPISADAVVFACSLSNTHRLVAPLVPPVKPPSANLIRVAHAGVQLDAESMLRPFVADFNNKILTLNLAHSSPNRLPESLRGTGSSLESVIFEVDEESIESIEARWHTHLESSAPGLQRHITETRLLQKSIVDHRWKPGSDYNRTTLVEWMSQNRMVSVAHESSDHHVLLDGTAIRARKAADRLFKGRRGRRGRRRRSA